ncbi:hypothetical protein [Thalassovita sp.]|uniref:hypothetical protein n=2 Tax=Thalassovita sp. TaxID=1979401 RepID=UPI00288255BD|nr:hypothetical protein [Thalassovita sp.]MDF1802108.1 hypothetical protein [Thalassovita sp.]
MAGFLPKSLASIVAFAVLSSGAFAAEPEPVQQHNSNAVWFENWIGLTNASMKVVDPTGKIEEVFAASGTPVYRLSTENVADGIYYYELSAATAETKKIVNPIDNGRGDAQRDETNVPFNMSGKFVVLRNVIITPKEVKEEALLPKKTGE